MNYFLIIFTILNLQYEIIQSQGASEDASGRVVLVMNDRGQRSGNEIEARRRSALDNNFMRFGRSGGGISKKWFLPTIRAARSNEEKGSNFIRFGRRDPTFYDVEDSPKSGHYDTRAGSNFIRFGRRDQDYDQFTPLQSRRASEDRGSNFIRFGKRDYDLYDDLDIPPRNVRGDDGKGSNFIRFGKRDEDEYNKRTKRSSKADPEPDDEEPAPHNLDRNERNGNFIRFGRNKSDMSDCPICHLHSMLSPIFSKYQQLPILIPPMIPNQFPNEMNADKRYSASNNKHMNSIRFG